MLSMGTPSVAILIDSEGTLIDSFTTANYHKSVQSPIAKTITWQANAHPNNQINQLFVC